MALSRPFKDTMYLAFSRAMAFKGPSRKQKQNVICVLRGATARADAHAVCRWKRFVG